jgi:hypothetical protein
LPLGISLDTYIEPEEDYENGSFLLMPMGVLTYKSGHAHYSARTILFVFCPFTQPNPYWTDLTPTTTTKSSINNKSELYTETWV